MSWLYSQALVEEYSEGISLDGAPSALWNGKHTRLPSWCSDKTMANCQLSQSGMTFKPLTENLGEGVLTSFLEAFPAKTSPVPEKAKASKESDHPCGNTWRESLEKYDLDTHTWKTHQCLWDEDLQPSSVILPKWGMMLNGVLWERTTLPPLTSGTGSGSWPTPTCQEVEHPDAELTDTGRRLSKDGKSSHSLNLADSVKQWPTPQARDWKGPSGRSMKGEENDLPNQVKKWPTPTVNDSHNCTMPPSQMTRDNLPGALLRKGDRPNGGHLNPTWVEWLMGWPIGWTTMEAITTLDWRDWSVDPADELPTDEWRTPAASEPGITPERLEPIDGGELGGMNRHFDKDTGRMAQIGLTQQVKLRGKPNTGTIPRVATGIKHRVGRLKAIGNGQVPQVAAMAWKILTT